MVKRQEICSQKWIPCCCPTVLQVENLWNTGLRIGSWCALKQDELSLTGFPEDRIALFWRDLNNGADPCCECLWWGWVFSFWSCIGQVCLEDGVRVIWSSSWSHSTAFFFDSFLKTKLSSSKDNYVYILCGVCPRKARYCLQYQESIKLGHASFFYLILMRWEELSELEKLINTYRLFSFYACSLFLLPSNPERKNNEVTKFNNSLNIAPKFVELVFISRSLWLQFSSSFHDIRPK